MKKRFTALLITSAALLGSALVASAALPTADVRMRSHGSYSLLYNSNQTNPTIEHYQYLDNNAGSLYLFYSYYTWPFPTESTNNLRQYVITTREVLSGSQWVRDWFNKVTTLAGGSVSTNTTSTWAADGMDNLAMRIVSSNFWEMANIPDGSLGGIDGVPDNGGGTWMIHAPCGNYGGADRYKRQAQTQVEVNLSGADTNKTYWVRLEVHFYDLLPCPFTGTLPIGTEINPLSSDGIPVWLVNNMSVASDNSIMMLVSGGGPLLIEPTWVGQNANSSYFYRFEITSAEVVSEAPYHNIDPTTGELKPGKIRIGNPPPTSIEDPPIAIGRPQAKAIIKNTESTGTSGLSFYDYQDVEKSWVRQNASTGSLELGVPNHSAALKVQTDGTVRTETITSDGSIWTLGDFVTAGGSARIRNDGGTLFFGLNDDTVVNRDAQNRVGIGTSSAPDDLRVYGKIQIGGSNGPVLTGDYSMLYVKNANESGLGSLQASTIQTTSTVTTGAEVAAQRWTLPASIGGSTTLIDNSYTFQMITTNGVTVNLPTAATCGGRTFIFKLTGSATSAVIDAYGTQTIDGAATYTLSGANKYVTIISDNSSNWMVIGNN